MRVILYPLICTSIFTYRICATLGGFSEMSIHLYQTSWRHTTHVMYWMMSRYHTAINYIYNIQLSLTCLWISSFVPFFLYLRLPSSDCFLNLSFFTCFLFYISFLLHLICLFSLFHLYLSLHLYRIYLTFNPIVTILLIPLSVDISS